MSISRQMREMTEKSSMIRKMFEEGMRMKKEFGADRVYDFSLGNPDVPPPVQFSQVLQAVAADERPGVHGYMPNPGFMETREAVAARLSREQGLPLSAADVVMTCGAAGALNVIFKALLDPGDEVLVPAPYFVEYGFYVGNHGGLLKTVATDAQFNLDLNAIEAALNAKTKAVLLNSPNNPTGQLYPASTLKQLGELLDRAGKQFGHDIFLIADEPYRNIVFDGNTVAPLMQASCNTIVASSYSKELSLPGERIGYIAVHPEMAEHDALLSALVLGIRILGFVNAPALMQRVVARLQDAAVDSSIYARRLDTFCPILDAAGLEYVRPKGAFYLFPKTPIADDAKFCALLKEERILAVPGRGFGLEGHIRLAFCVDEKVIRASAEGFKKAVAAAKEV